MRERPIIFSGPMVRAIREDRKPQTRRTKGLNQINETPDQWCTPIFDPYDGSWVFHRQAQFETEESIDILRILCPYGIPGDRLWVRETCVISNVCRYSPGDILPASAEVGISYRADHPTGDLGDGDGGYNFYRVEGDEQILEARRLAETHYEKWIPSIFMPRWASRITLKITDVRVQRVQEISEEDAEAEGLTRKWDEAVGPVHGGWHWEGGFDTGKQSYAFLWDSINAKRGFGWSANPWVWAITFRRAG